MFQPLRGLCGLLTDIKRGKSNRLSCNHPFVGNFKARSATTNVEIVSKPGSEHATHSDLGSSMLGID
jgi:hypothetical protein